LGHPPDITAGSHGAPVGSPGVNDAVNAVCPWTGKPISPEGLTLYAGAVVGFANAELRDQFARAVRQFEDALAVRRAETAGNSE